MKKVNIVLSVLVTLFLTLSLVPPVSAQSNPLGVEISYAAGKASKEVLVKILNNTNRYINLSLDNRSEYHVYNLSVAPGVNQYWVYSGMYNYNYDTCDKHVGGHVIFKAGTKLKIYCHPGRNHDIPDAPDVP